MSKHAIEAYSDSLRRELTFLDIPVIKIQPGPFRTEMVESIDATGDAYNTATITFSAATGNTITLGDDGTDNDGNLRIAGGAGPQLDLPTPAGGAETLTINTGGGDDAVTINDLDTSGGTAFDADLIINGQAGDDTLDINYGAGGSPSASGTRLNLSAVTPTPGVA